VIAIDERAKRPSIRIEISSRLPLDADSLWARVATPEGVNTELMPLVRMTFPKGVAFLELRPDQLRRPLLVSWLLAFGFVPFDRHVLTFDRVGQRSFFERSHSILQRKWDHDRAVVPDGGHSILSDRVEVIPRIWLFSMPTRWLVRRIFEHRHARLRSLYGDSQTPGDRKSDAHNGQTSGH